MLYRAYGTTMEQPTDIYGYCQHHQNAFVRRHCSNRQPCKQNECSNRYPCRRGEYLMPNQCRCRRGMPARPPAGAMKRYAVGGADAEVSFEQHIREQLDLLQDGLNALYDALEERERQRNC